MFQRTVIDISRTIRSGAPVYPGDPAIGIARTCSHENGDPYQLTELSGSVHLLTHLDAPRHFFAEGEAIDAIALQRCCGPALVIASPGGAVTPDLLPPIGELKGLDVLFRTRDPDQPFPEKFDPDHGHVTLEAAELLIEAGVNLVGIDELDIEKSGDETFAVHRTLLKAGILILEGLDLSQAQPGKYWLSALPLKIEGSDGAPCRAALFSHDPAVK